MLAVKRSPNRGGELLQACHRKTHITVVKPGHDRRNRAICPVEGNAERATVRVLDVGMALAVTSTKQPNQWEQPAPKRVTGQGNGDRVRG